ncbi:hypothetical protein BSNT_09180 [Bacillus subtilis subsp. natto BEST195]|nr:hypothetical protein BSNT_09180 [Bacillus subtilis subsp. natto BEST195]
MVSKAFRTAEKKIFLNQKGSRTSGCLYHVFFTF